MRMIAFLSQNLIDLVDSIGELQNAAVTLLGITKKCSSRWGDTF